VRRSRRTADLGAREEIRLAREKGEGDDEVHALVRHDDGKDPAAVHVGVRGRRDAVLQEEWQRRGRGLWSTRREQQREAARRAALHVEGVLAAEERARGPVGVAVRQTDDRT